jgi:hypothetical protein
MATATRSLRAKLRRLEALMEGRRVTTALASLRAGPPLIPPRAGRTLAEFAKEFLSAEKRSGELEPLAPASDLHRTLVDDLGSLRNRRGQRLCYLAPRGSAKSTWSTFAYPLHAACHQEEPFIVLTSDTANQAEVYLETIKRELEENDALAAAYPGACGKGPLWRGDRIRLRNGVQIASFSTGRKTRGLRAGASRPSLIVVDDPQNKDHIISELQRSRSWEWFTKDVMNAGAPRTNVVVLGTALHVDCIVCRLQKTPGWQTKVFKQIVDMPRRMDLWREWELILHDWESPDREAKARAFYEAHPEMDE